jgi:hypothetical protein
MLVTFKIINTIFSLFLDSFERSLRLCNTTEVIVFIIIIILIIFSEIYSK